MTTGTTIYLYIPNEQLCCDKVELTDENQCGPPGDAARPEPCPVTRGGRRLPGPTYDPHRRRSFLTAGMTRTSPDADAPGLDGETTRAQGIPDERGR
ncbi:hypothetical protein GCM10010269_73280 [Streptomyces humidus]|uniref:Uncharacterized protein n=1 Tax=Streptomyces humidus TaxID=52259 RepID=A0A918G7U4_9ACTN|nr:hypothetical protein GCM10010269_73280 [Streptomyces humidus]